ncbi:hypothetical protein PhiSM_gp70 [Cellulophaga phage phiSM]|nr:hypothetical protein PhiSM_gp70 [Cellulophaga phage phiSM]AGO49389.1 hypothetical protein Phi3:1_gp70 [Cellulophaga phage phi3:1]
MQISSLTIGQKKALFESLNNQKSPMTEAEKRTLDALRPTIKVIEVKRKRDVNTQCPWEKVITTYKSCTLSFNRFGVYSRIELPMAETHRINIRIRQETYGHRLIK